MSVAITAVIDSRPRDLGGFEVRRILPASPRVIPSKMVGPFIFLDQMGPASFAPGTGLDVRPHPHIGLATLTWLFEGEILHRDSLGFVQAIRPGEVNWMTAGRGIVHSERTPPALRAQGISLHGMQCWVALPRTHEEVEPAFEHLPAPALPGFDGDGLRYRVLAGTCFGLTAPARTHSALGYAAIELATGAVLSIPPEHPERAIYVAAGEVVADGQRLITGQLGLLAPRKSVSLRAGCDSRLMLLGGEPLEGERHIWWNFVNSDPDRIERAKRDWQEGRFGRIPDDPEFIPLPAD